MNSLTIATYNIHKCKGIDGRVAPERIVAVLQEIGADLVALQEVLSARDTIGSAAQARYIARALGMHFVSGSNVISDTHEYGNIILSRVPVVNHLNHNISLAAREPRGCLQADLAVGDHTLHFFNTHFGLGYAERAYQAQRLLTAEILTRPQISGPRILVGDFNEWFHGRASRLLGQNLHDPSRGLLKLRKRTHPCLLPLFKLDKIYIEPTLTVKRSYVHRSRLARVASDHLPLVAQIELPN